MNLLVLFGSSSDAAVYEPLIEALNQHHQTQFYALSAHRNANQLRECLQKEDYDAVVAGAGLAAHLPGVVASLIQKPVIGIPVAAHLGGMDALLSILQMPAGVPVHTFASDQFHVLSEMLREMAGEYDESKFQLVAQEEHFKWVTAKVEKVENYCSSLGIELLKTRQARPYIRGVALFHLQQDPPPKMLCVPVLPSVEVREIKTTMECAKLFKTPSLFVGLNNLVNGLIATLQWVDIPHKENILEQLKQGKLT